MTDATLGGAGGSLLGALVTAAFAASRGWQFALPARVLIGAAPATVLVGALAGVYPAARMPPTAALASV